MHKLTFLILVFSAVLAVTFGQDKYPTKYDSLDVKKILGNNRVLSNYIKCVLGEGSCTAEGRELKRILPDALATGCEKCSDKQRNTANEVIQHLQTNRPDEWKRLLNKYDPKGLYQQNYMYEYKSAEATEGTTTA